MSGIIVNLSGLLLLIGFVWLLIIAFTDTQWWWGLIVLFFPFIGGLIFGILRMPRTLGPLVLFLIGWLVGGGSYFMMGPM